MACEGTGARICLQPSCAHISVLWVRRAHHMATFDFHLLKTPLKCGPGLCLQSSWVGYPHSLSNPPLEYAYPPPPPPTQRPPSRQPHLGLELLCNPIVLFQNIVPRVIVICTHVADTTLSRCNCCLQGCISFFGNLIGGCKQ